MPAPAGHSRSRSAAGLARRARRRVGHDIFRAGLRAVPPSAGGGMIIGGVGTVTNVDGNDGAFSRPALAITTEMYGRTAPRTRGHDRDVPFHVPQAGREDHRHRSDRHRDDVPALPPAHVLLETRPGPGDPEHLGTAAGTLLPHLVPPSARIGLSPPAPVRGRSGTPVPDNSPRYAAPAPPTRPGHPELAHRRAPHRAAGYLVRPYPACAVRGTAEHCGGNARVEPYEEAVMGWLWAIIVGFVLGLIAKAIIPGKQHSPLAADHHLRHARRHRGQRDRACRRRRVDLRHRLVAAPVPAGGRGHHRRRR